MILSQFILIFILIENCFTDSDQCAEEFNKELVNYCVNIISTNPTTKCVYLNNNCVSTQDCSKGDKDNCLTIFPQDFTVSKCVLNTANRCEPANRLCNEYGTSIKVDGKSFTLDSCESLFPGEGKDRCDRTTSGGCQGYKDECTGLTGDDCTNNIPRDHSKSCGIAGTACQGIKRKCNDAYLLNYHKNEMNEEFCKTLEPSTGDGKKCHYNYEEEKCQDYYEKCSDFKGTASEDSCLNFKPLFTDDENYFDDEIHKCVLDGTTCKFAEKTCSDFPSSGNDRYLCERLTTKTNNKACHYDPNYEGNKCQEQFSTCQLFYDNLETKNKKKQTVKVLELLVRKPIVFGKKKVVQTTQ